jgi:putative effector of murein hydrolase LrgA (UPF0299 family)
LRRWWWFAERLSAGLSVAFATHDCTKKGTADPVPTTDPPTHQAGIKFPSALAGMFGVFAVLCLVGEKPAAKILAFFNPALDWIAKWLPLFYVPALVTLPLALQGIPGADLARIIGILLVGMVATLLFTAQITVVIREAVKTPVQPVAKGKVRQCCGRKGRARVGEQASNAAAAAAAAACLVSPPPVGTAAVPHTTFPPPTPHQPLPPPARRPLRVQPLHRLGLHRRRLPGRHHLRRAGPRRAHGAALRAGRHRRRLPRRQPGARQVPRRAAPRGGDGRAGQRRRGAVRGAAGARLLGGAKGVPRQGGFSGFVLVVFGGWGWKAPLVDQGGVRLDGVVWLFQPDSAPPRAHSHQLIALPLSPKQSNPKRAPAPWAPATC